MFDHGFHLTCQAMRRQIAAMPHDLYLIRLIHYQTGRAFPGERLWTAAQLVHPGTVRFLRVRNREGCDVYVLPYADQANSGYILVDLDHGDGDIIQKMRSDGVAPCVVLQTSPGNLQAWVHVSSTPLQPSAASWIGKQLARRYSGDWASTDWRHLGRLAGFTNQKPQRRNARGYPPWVTVRHAAAGLAAQGAALRQEAEDSVGDSHPALRAHRMRTRHAQAGALPTPTVGIYADWLRRLRILERFPEPDWSIADKWVAKELLRKGTPAMEVAAILRTGSPGFPRRHSHPQDYLVRTLACAAGELQAASFPRRDAILPGIRHTNPSAL